MRPGSGDADLLARISHELRNPLSSVLGFAQLLALTDLTADQSDGVSRILAAGRRLRKLVEEVDTLARIAAGQLALSSEPVATAGVVGEAIALMEPLAGAYGVRIEDRATGDSWVRADRERLVQILCNLLSHALVRSRRGGTVEIRQAHEPGGWVLVTVAGSGTAGTGTATATGDARPATPSDRLPDELADVEGTDLGLELSTRLAGAMGASVTVETGQGGACVLGVALAPVEARWTGDLVPGDLVPGDLVPEVGALRRSC